MAPTRASLAPQTLDCRRHGPTAAARTLEVKDQILAAASKLHDQEASAPGNLQVEGSQVVKRLAAAPQALELPSAGLERMVGHQVAAADHHAALAWLCSAEVVNPRICRTGSAASLAQPSGACPAWLGSHNIGKLHGAGVPLPARGGQCHAEGGPGCAAVMLARGCCPRCVASFCRCAGVAARSHTGRVVADRSYVVADRCYDGVRCRRTQSARPACRLHGSVERQETCQVKRHSCAALPRKCCCGQAHCAQPSRQVAQDSNLAQKPANGHRHCARAPNHLQHCPQLRCPAPDFQEHCCTQVVVRASCQTEAADQWCR